MRSKGATYPVHALKEGLEPSGPEWDAAVRHLRKAVKEHNAKFWQCSFSAPKHKAPEPQESSERRLRVLGVEDEAIVALEIEENLRDAGFEVVGPAARVAEALELSNEFGRDAAVLDINLGTETSEPIALFLSEQRTPFVTVSGYSQDQRPKRI
jgi:phosphoribosylamine-glycine ligase